MFISKHSIPIASIPPKTHGDQGDLEPFVTVKQAFSRLDCKDRAMSNMNTRTTTVRRGQQLGFLVRHNPHDLAPAM